MDSPLMPTLHGRAARSPGSPSNLMGDLSLADADDSFLPPAWTDQACSSRSHPESAARTAKPRFSLFAPQASAPDGVEEQETAEVEEVGEEEVEEMHDEETIHPRIVTSAEREDRLRESLYELRQMNEVFEGFLGALEAARGHNERLAARVRQTSALLDQYTALLGQTEHTKQLLSNPRWTGADDDAAAIAAAEAARIAAEEAEAERRRLVEARAAEEQRRRDDAEVAKLLKEATNRGRGGTRGGRGRGGAPSRIQKPTSGKYGHVQSSGYGPKRS